jgi:mRNA interferase MazF
LRVPDRGDLITLDFNPQAGHEQMKRRPALVLSPASFNEVLGMAYVAPISTKAKGHAFEVPLPAEAKVKGVIMMHQLKSLDWRARGARYAGQVSATTLIAAVAIVRHIIDTP